MACYHFNIHNGAGITSDEEGQEFGDAEAARTEALKGARSLIAADVLEGRLDLSGRIEVTGDDGNLLFIISFAEAVEQEAEPGGDQTQVNRPTPT